MSEIENEHFKLHVYDRHSKGFFLMRKTSRINSVQLTLDNMQKFFLVNWNDSVFRFVF